MRPIAGGMRVMEVREVATTRGPARVFLHVDFGPDGAVHRVGWSPPPQHQATEADRAALAMLEKVAGAMRNGVGLPALLQRAEAMVTLIEALQRIEDRHGERVRQHLAGAAA
jgi:hypothetical protein